MSKFCMMFLLFVSTGFAAVDDHFLTEIEKQLSQTMEDKILLTIEKEQLLLQTTELEVRIRERKKQIIKRLRSVYSLKKYRWGDLLFNKNLNELDRQIKILKNLNQYDVSLFGEYENSLRQLAYARKNIQETEDQIQKNIESLEKKQKEFQKIEQERVLSLLENKKESLLLMKGRLSKPIDAKLKTAFGAIQDQSNQYYLMSQGEYYQSTLKSSVKSIGLGKVIFRDALSRWRETLIIQHADNYYSVYAGLKNVKFSVGETVAQDTVLGSAAEDEFYFELRHFSNPINPKRWYRESL